jgi:DUF4097 and DUF4098 domain-containing protein YvlB
MTARTDRKLALVVGGILAAVFTLCSALQVAEWTTGSVERSTHETIAGPVSALSVQARGADVRLVASETDSVTVDTHSSGTLKTPKLEVHAQGTRVEVSGGCAEITFGSCDADLIVGVPASASVRVEAGSGDIAAEGLSGSVYLHSGSGDVVGRDLSGSDVQLRSDAGDLTADGTRSRSVLARTLAGDVLVSVDSVPESVEARSSSGDVDVFVPPGEELYRVDAETRTGDRSVGIDTSGSASRSITARTDSGDVHVDYEP